MRISEIVSIKLARWQRIIWALLAATLPVLSVPAAAAPGTLAQSPLFLSSEVEPNIMFVIDDSGSMDWEVSTRDANNDGRFTGTQPDGSNPTGAGSVKHRDSDDDNTAECGFNDEDFYGYIYIVEFGSNTYGDGSNDCNTADDQAWRIRNSNFNPLYFDPNKVYRPWAGVDKNGNPFTDVPVTSAPNDPYNPGERINLTQDNSNWTGSGRTTSDRDNDGQPDGFRYYTWQDLDNDGLFDNGEQTEHLVKNAHPVIQQNFANWFSYYRKREFVAKAAYGRVIAGAENTRMGLMTLHNNNSVNTAIAFLNSDPATGAKRDLLDALYSINSNGGTPLRSTFYKCGRYLECKSGSPFSTCPALSAENGGACQQNFSIVMTDGFYNGSFSGLGNRDGDNSSSWDSGSSGPFGDGYSNTLGDIAMYFYERDLQTGLPDSVPIVPGLDEAQHQHMVTYTVGFGVNGTINNMPLNSSDPFTWPNPGSSYLNRIDDLRHAAYNGRGKYLDARDPSTLQSSLEDALANIADRIGSAAAVTFNSGTLSTNSVVYLSLFNSNRWSGQLLAYKLNGITGAVSSNADWDAAEKLENRNLNTNPRTILTYDGSDGSAFQWSELTIRQQADLCVGPQSNGCSLNNGGISGSTTIAKARLEFLRGDRSDEGTGFGFRVRSKRLGDFVHSGPVFVGPPEQSWPDQAPFPTGSNSYSAFQQGAANNRSKMVYIGANDGMLHGFNAVSGEEELAYIPDSLFSTTNNQGLHYLADPAYVHRYYVDLEPVAGDAFIRTDLTQSAEAWHTVLVGGLRAGGQGYFALDITDPSQFSESNAADIVMWEFTSADDDDLGHSYGTPVIAMMENGRWAAIVSDGYEDSGDGKAQLFIIYLDGGLDGVWTDGRSGTPVDYVKIPTHAGNRNDRNSLAAPAVIDLNGNGAADRVYAGDLRGDMWVFDLSSSDDSSWSTAYSSSIGSPRPLFNGTSDQPITSKPVVISHPSVAGDSNNQPNTMVLFGTGQYLVSGDNSSSDTQAFYGVWDRGNMNRNTGHLVEQTLSTAPGNANVRIISDLPVDYNAINGTRQFGWYVNLPASGERVVSSPIIRAGNVFFNTMIPSLNECTYGGSGWLMSISSENGGSPNTTPFDLNDDEKVDENDMITISGGGPDGEDVSVAAVGEAVQLGLPTESAFLGNHQYTPNSSTSKGDDIDERNLEEITGPFSGRLSWEELINQ